MSRTTPETARSGGGLPGRWWAIPAEEVLIALGTDPRRGLDAEAVERNRSRFGRNEWQGRGGSPLWVLLRDSIKSPMILLLLAIAGISLALGQVREALVMGFVVAAYIGIHLLNRARSERTMARLRQLQAPRTQVVREGHAREIPIADAVVGDILPLGPGSRIAADARLIESVGLLVNEAALTGESAPVAKDAAEGVAPDAPLAERPTAVHAGTTVLDGEGRAVAVAVGSRTELGKVAALSLQAESGPTPLQREMADLARTLAFVAVGVSALIPGIGLLLGYDVQQMILTWLSLTFLMVPGQPPIIISMALALASLELSRKGVIVRRLYGAETLGAVTTILSDKTGTMTENRMELSGILLPDGQEVRPGDEGQRRAWEEFLGQARWAIPGASRDPTDLALREAARSLGGQRGADPGRLVDEVGFSRGKDRRWLEYKDDSAHTIFVAGAPEFVIAHSTHWQSPNGPARWDESMRQEVAARVARLAGEGKRLTAYARRQGPAAHEITDLTIIGMAVLTDPVRPHVRDAVARLARAGVRTVMVTGDNGATAAFVAGQVGLDGQQVLMGSELEGRSDEAVERAIGSTSVFARMSPEGKLRIVQAVGRLGHTVAVTGDGVNDAPALRAAHVGIAMGQRGTEVAREAADLVLTDDDFTRLPEGVAIGRKAYDNFRKGITYYLSAKAILLTIFVAPLLLSRPFPLAPIQIIATELLMDLASSTIFVTEAAEPGVMERPPRRRSRFLSRQVGLRVLRNMAGLATAILIVYFVSLPRWGTASARTAAFATWLLGHIVLALNLKQGRQPLLHQGILSNRFAIGWLAGMIALVVAMTSLPPIQTALRTTPLAPAQWAMVTTGALLASGWMEVRKWAWRRSLSERP